MCIRDSPSTYAPTISTIISSGYVGKEKKQLFPTELGQIVTDIMKEYFEDIVNVTFTASMEEDVYKRQMFMQIRSSICATT